MPNFPTYERSVEPRGYLIPSAGPSLAESFGAGLQDLGQAGGQMANDMARANAVLQARQVKDELKNTAAQYQAFSNDTDAHLADASQKAPPGAAGFIDQQLADFDKRSAEFLKSVPDSAKSYAQEQLLQLRGGVQKSAIEFQVTSRDVFARQRTVAILDQASAGLVNNPGKLDLTRSSVVDMIHGLHLDPQREAAALSDVDQKLTSAALAGRVLQDPRAALSELQAGHWNAAGADDVVRYQGAAMARIKSDEAQARQDQQNALAASRGDLLTRLDIAMPSMQATGVIPTDNKGRPIVDRNEIADLIPGRTGEAMLRKFDAAQQMGQDRLSVTGTSLDDDFTRYHAMLPAPGQPWSAEDQQRAAAFDDVIKAKAKVLTEDPATWVMQPGGAVAQAWQTRDDLAANPNSDPRAVQQATSAAVNATTQAELDAGTPPWMTKPLSKAQAQAFAGTLQTAKPEALSSVAQQISSYGPQAVGQVIAAGAPAGFALLTAVGDPTWTQKAAASMALKPDAQAAILSSTSTTRSLVETSVAAKLAAFANTAPASTRALYQSGLTDLAIYNLGQGAGSVAAAVDAATTPFLSTFRTSGKLRVPAEVDIGSVTRGLATIQGEIATGKRDVIAPPSLLPGSTQESDLATFRKEVGGFQWITNEAGDGAILTLPNGAAVAVPVRASQYHVTIERLEIPFSDAAMIGTGAAASMPSGRPGYTAPIR